MADKWTVGTDFKRYNKRFTVFNKIEAYMKQHQMVTENDVIIAGVSGGADSVCLFLVLEEYCKKKNAQLVVVHMNHGLRKEAVKDAEYVQRLCEEFGVPFHLYEKDIARMAKERGIGAEEAGRYARYKAFFETLKQYGGKGKIAVAHHKNDRAETVLFHLFRGSNLTGLTGISPVRDNVIRPLLCVEREEIEDYLKEKGRSFCIDSSNAENTYTRNKIRNVILPYAENEICENASAHIAEAAEELGKIRNYIDEQTDLAENRVLALQENEVCIRVEEIIKYHEVIRKQLILRALEYMVPGRKDIGAVHVNDILSLFGKQSGKQIHLPYELIAENQYGQVVIRKRKNLDHTDKDSIAFPIPGRVRIGPDKVMEIQVFLVDKGREIPRKTYTKWFDYDKIKCYPMIRHRRTGDYLIISENGNHKSIKEYFIEEKIPREERDKMLLLAEGNHVLWVIGKRISEYYKVTEKTKTILQVNILNE